MYRDQDKPGQNNAQAAHYPGHNKPGGYYPGVPYPGMELARVYIPIQRLGKVYSPDRALELGTLFPELYRPYPY